MTNDEWVKAGRPERRRRDFRDMVIVGAIPALLVIACVATFAALTAVGAVSKINQERARNVLTTCVETNTRHDDVIRTLDQLLKEAEKTASPAQLKRMRESRAGTVLLLEALVPHRDCNALVKRSVSDVP